MDRIHGQCLCGAVRFNYKPPSLWSSHCHCSLCRRAHGAAFVTWVGTAEDGFQFEQQHDLKWYQSSADSRRGFCARCGSTLFFQSSRWPGEMHIVRTALQEDVDIEPQAHSYWDTHVNWYPFNDNLPRGES